MRHNQNRRSRGRSRKGPNPLTRSYESNGPDVKVRGTAAHVAEKYMTLARDAHVSGDVVAAENYLQHAEHYNRIVMAAQTQFQQSQPQFREGGEEGYDDERQMNGRGRDRFESSNRDDEEGGEDRFDSQGSNRFDSPGNQFENGGGEGDDDRGYRPAQGQGRQNDHDQRQRGPRPDRFEPRRDRPDYRDNREGRDRNEPRFQRQDEPQPEIAVPPVEAAAPPAEEPAPSQPRRRRGRPPRGESAEVAVAGRRRGDARWRGGACRFPGLTRLASRHFSKAGLAPAFRILGFRSPTRRPCPASMPSGFRVGQALAGGCESAGLRGRIAAPYDENGRPWGANLKIGRSFGASGRGAGRKG